MLLGAARGKIRAEAGPRPGARIPDVEVMSYEGLPHNICDSVPDRCADDVLKFLAKRFPSG